MMLLSDKLQYLRGICLHLIGCLMVFKLCMRYTLHSLNHFSYHFSHSPTPSTHTHANLYFHYFFTTFSLLFSLLLPFFNHNPLISSYIPLYLKQAPNFRNLPTVILVKCSMTKCDISTKTTLKVFTSFSIERQIKTNRETNKRTKK